MKIYFIQTSMSSYSRHKKGLKAVPNTPVKSGCAELSKKSVREYYSELITTTERKYFYVYATTSMPHKNYPYFLDLTEYFPF